MVLYGKSSHKYPVNAGVPHGSILGPTLFLLYINDLLDDVISNVAIYAHDAALYSLEWPSELQSDLWGTEDWDRKWLVDFNAGKTQLVLVDQSTKIVAIDVKMDGSVLEERSSFKMLELSLLSKLGWNSYIISIAKTASKKIGEVSFS